MTAMMNESIYNLIPQDNDSGLSASGNATTYQPSYTSTFKQTVAKEANAKKVPCKNMGPSNGVKVNPNEFLKSGTGIDMRRSLELKNKSNSPKPSFLSTKPPVPRHDESPLFAPPSTKNHVMENTRRAVAVQPREVEATLMDIKGKRTVLDESGLLPKYTNASTYGKTPAYLEKRHQEETQRKMEHTRAVQMEIEMEASKRMSEAEREEILAGLRANWNKVHYEYQGISCITDTIPKRTRKANLEAKLNELEADIQRIESNKVIYIR